MSIEENKSIVRRFFEVGPSKGDLDAANELLAPRLRSACAAALLSRSSRNR